MNKSFGYSQAVIAALAMNAMSDGAESAPTTFVGKEFKFGFKTPEIVVRDEDGKEISRSKGEAHPAVKAVLPVPTVEELQVYLSQLGKTQTVGDREVPTIESKVAALIVEAVQDMIFQAGRAQINEFLEKNQDKPEARFTATDFDLSRLSLEYIASLERAQRGAWAPSEQDLEAFCTEYTNVFVHEVQYDPKKVKVHCDQYKKGFIKIKADKVALGKMAEFLTIWASKASEAAASDHEATYNWLANRIKKYQAAEEKNYADAL